MHHCCLLSRKSRDFWGPRWASQSQIAKIAAISVRQALEKQEKRPTLASKFLAKNQPCKEIQTIKERKDRVRASCYSSLGPFSLGHFLGDQCEHRHLSGSHRSTHTASDLASRALASQAKPQRVGNGRNTVSRVLFRKRELTEFYDKLGEFCEKLGEFAFTHK